MSERATARPLLRRRSKRVGRNRALPVVDRLRVFLRWPAQLAVLGLHSVRVEMERRSQNQSEDRRLLPSSPLLPPR